MTPTTPVDPRTLRVDDLLYLLAVADSGRLSTAAATLGVDHTTVSRRIRALEKVFSARLLERGVGGWQLTDVGRSVADRARPIQRALGEILDAGSAAPSDALTGTFRVTAPDGFGAVIAVPALARLRASHPGLDIELVTATGQLALHQSGFDLAVAIGQPPASKRLFSERLADYTLGLYAHPRYLDRYGMPETVDDLEQHAVIFYVDSLQHVGDLDLTRILPRAQTRFSSTNIFAQLEATVAAAGIGVLPHYLATREPALIELTALGIRPRLTFTLAARQDGVSRPAVRAVRQALHDEVRTRQHELVPPPLGSPR